MFYIKKVECKKKCLFVLPGISGRSSRYWPREHKILSYTAQHTKVYESGPPCSRVVRPCLGKIVEGSLGSSGETVYWFVIIVPSLIVRVMSSRLIWQLLYVSRMSRLSPTPLSRNCHLRVELRSARLTISAASEPQYAALNVRHLAKARSGFGMKEASPGARGPCHFSTVTRVR